MGVCVIRPDSDVRLYPVPFGLEAATIAWIGVGIAVASAAYSLFMMSNIDAGGYTSSTGRSLDLNPAKQTARNWVMRFVKFLGACVFIRIMWCSPLPGLMPPILRKCASRCCCVSVSVI
jgi:hypothetical protein